MEQLSGNAGSLTPAAMSTMGALTAAAFKALSPAQQLEQIELAEEGLRGLRAYAEHLGDALPALAVLERSVEFARRRHELVHNPVWSDATQAARDLAEIMRELAGLGARRHPQSRGMRRHIRREKAAARG